MLSKEDLEATKTVEEVVAFREQIKARNAEMDAEWEGRTFDGEARAEFKLLGDLESEAIEREREFRLRRARVADSGEKPDTREAIGTDLSTRVQLPKSRIPENVWDLGEYRKRTDSYEDMVGLMRDGARKASEAVDYPHEQVSKDTAVRNIQRLFERTYAPEGVDAREVLARHILRTGSPVYQRAFGKYVAGQPLTPDEQRAIATVGTTTTGGSAVPFTLDPTVILTSDGALNPLPGMARNETTVGNTWKGVTSAGVTASYGTEAVAVTDGAPTLGAPEVTVRKAKALIEFSIEADQDWPRLQSEMARLLQDAKDNLEAEKFVNGTGTNEPEGVLYGIASTYNVGTTGDGLDTGDFRTLTTRLGDRWEPRASWLAHRAIYTEAERLDHAAGVGSDYRPLAAGEPRILLGYPRFNTSAMESDFTTATNRVAIFGDFNQFLIVTKVGLTVELIPHLVDGNGNPTGERGLFAYWRNSSVVLVDSAFRVLTIGVVTTGI